MNFFEKQFKNIEINPDFTPTIVGRDLYLNHNGLTTKVSFSTMYASDHYDCIRLETKSRDVIINKQTMLFEDLIGVIEHGGVSQTLIPHIWKYRHEYDWYIYKPTQKDWEAMSNAIATYIGVWHGL